MHDDSQRTAQNPSQTVGAGAGRTDQTPNDPGTNRDALSARGDQMNPNGSTNKPRPDEPGPYDDDGALAQQTPGLDPDEIRKDAGPDWPAGTKGDLEAETNPPGGSGASPNEPNASSGR